MRNKRNYTLQFNEGGIREDSSSDHYQAHFLLNFHFLVVADKKFFFVTGENTGFSKRIGSVHPLSESLFPLSPPEERLAGVSTALLSIDIRN